MSRHTQRWTNVAWYAVYLMWPITYAILVFDDLTHHETWNQRLLPIATIDFIGALVWPAVWVYWIVQGLLHHSTALTRLIGL